MDSFNILKEGDSGEDVILLQQMLKINNLFPGVVTGVFGPVTTLYVKSFQEKYGIYVDGVVNSNTWDKLYDLTTPSTNYAIINKPTLALGDQGDEVKEVQTILQTLLYYTGVVDGYFSNEVLTSVKSFQYVNKLVPDGIVGNATWSSLLSSYAPMTDCSEITVPDGDTYVVVAGDTLYSIARKYNMSLDELRSLNNLSSDSLSIGQVLIVKSGSEDVTPPDNVSTYTVVAGDTLYSVAKRFNLGVEELKILNNLTSDILSIGQVLKVTNDSNDITPPSGDYNTYTVMPGDTLYSIAGRYGISVSELMSINNLNNNILSIGQVLYIPSTNEYITYVVKSGDNLYSIANRFNTSVDSIMKLNNLSSNLLSIGQVLKINNTGAISYTVVPGDNLYSIARRFNTSVSDIMNKNGLSSNILSIGQVLVI